MKTLLLVRHAKSSWNSDVSTDFERPLNNRGMRDAPEMANRLISRGLIPDKLISSTAARALATARLLVQGLSLDSKILATTDKIYEAPVQALLDTICGIDDRFQTVIMVGHNPGMSATGNYLCEKARLEMPTCAMACLQLETDSWSHVYRDCATMLWYDYPKSDYRNTLKTTGSN